MIASPAILEEPMHVEKNNADELASRVSGATVIRRNEPLAKRTTLRVGGPADLYVQPASETDLAAVLQFCAVRGLKFFVLGRGSNLLVRDGAAASDAHKENVNTILGLLFTFAGLGWCIGSVAGGPSQ